MGKRMRKAEPELQERLSVLIGSMGYELLGCELAQMGSRQVFRLYIDSPVGVTADDCSKVSRQVSALMDAEDPLRGRYLLEVSSPGIDRPLFELKHFASFVGSKVNLRLQMPIDGRRKFKGVLVQVEGEDIHLQVEDIEQTVVIPFSAIDRANVIGEIKF